LSKTPADGCAIAAGDATERATGIAWHADNSAAIARTTQVFIATA
jgi:hypothetical protein